MPSEIDLRILETMRPAETPERLTPGANGTAGSSFASTLSDAVSALDKTQLDADAQARKVANGEGNLHEMAISLEKADISMRLAMKVRNKVVDAYNEIMRMSV
jgi:flagellar hook-basal body complex protein FliE